MPEDGSITQTWDVAHCTVRQTVRLDDVNKFNALTHVSAEELANCRVYLWQEVHRGADVIIFDGDFGLEDDDTLKDNGRKLLVARMQSMLDPSISNADIASMYSNLSQLAGRKGYEVTRTSGTAGFTTHQSHADLLFVLHKNDSLLPNKAGSSLIIPHGKFYFILYTKHKAKDGEHPIGITTYVPPKPGGALVLNSNAIDAWPILGDFASTNLVSTNCHHCHHPLLPPSSAATAAVIARPYILPW